MYLHSEADFQRVRNEIPMLSQQYGYRGLTSGSSASKRPSHWTTPAQRLMLCTGLCAFNDLWVRIDFPSGVELNINENIFV